MPWHSLQVGDWVVLAVQLSVDAGHVELADLIVAGGAIHCVDDRLARPDMGGVDLRVALAAGNVPKPARLLAVAGMAHFGRVDVHRFPVACAAQSLIGMATHAIPRQPHPAHRRRCGSCAADGSPGRRAERWPVFPRARHELSSGEPVSICEWHFVQVAAIFLRLIEDAGSVCGKMRCGVWQLAQFGATGKSLLQQRLAVNALGVGARREMLESYVKRLEDLERIADSFKGVSKSFAIQAGREIRIIVENSNIGDEGLTLLAHDIRKKIEKELSYPGQIKIVVIREARAVEFAR